MMQSNPQTDSRQALASATHPKMYDPSAPLRARMMPPPPPVTTAIPSNDPYTSNPVLLLDDPANSNIKNRSVVTRIPTYFYPRYNDPNNAFPVQPRESNSNVPPPPVVEQPVPRETVPYTQPMPYPMDPYASGQYYPYSTPYLIPLTTNIPQQNPVPPVYDQSKADVIASHQQDADLSRLEVYHFTPKQNTSLSMGHAPVPPPQPIIQYHVYPYPPGQQQPMPTQQSSYPPPWYAHPPYEPPYLPEPSQPIAPLIETKARGSQTEPPSTKSRGISPMHVPATSVHDQSHPYVHHMTAHADQYQMPTRRLDRSFYDEKSWEPLSDCRCMDCQRERSKVLNYYPD